MRYESPRRWLLGPASTDGDGLGHSPAWLIGPSGATLGRRPDYSITSSARPSSDSGKVRPNASPSNRGDPNKNCPRFTRPPGTQRFGQLYQVAGRAVLLFAAIDLH